VHDVVWDDDVFARSSDAGGASDEDEGAGFVPPPRLDWTDDVQRRSQVSALCSVGAPNDAHPAVRHVAVAWLGSGASPGVLGICEVRHSRCVAACALLRAHRDTLTCSAPCRRTGAPCIRERATVVVHASVWDVAAPPAAPVAVMGTSQGATRVDLRTLRLQPLLGGGSDVLAVAAEADAGVWALCGLRNGRVVLADSRAPPAGAACAAPLSFRLGAAVTGVSLLAGEAHAAALACAIDGTLARWDLRAAARGPVARYEGHVNSATLALRHAIDADAALLAAPGEDGAVRVWSLRAAGAPLFTGCAVPPPPPAMRGAGAALPPSFRVMYTALAFDPRPGACAPAAAPPRLWLGAHEGLALAWPGHAAAASASQQPPRMQRWPAH
jgi:hypothetical protein